MKHFISLIPSIERQFYGSIFAVLGCLWCAFGTATLGLLLMTFLPDDRGWGHVLRGLEGLVPPDPMFWSS
ncbi:MAG: hypothetical protein QOI53_451 [Verrucomicrobiota bacterium]|nr:hypothetical protein [Verrucomicrobiota bacterium]